VNSKKKARTLRKKTIPKGMGLKIYSLAYGFLFFVNSISGNLALKKNQTKPKVWCKTFVKCLLFPKKKARTLEKKTTP
jgi:hypothetical protein